MMDPPGAKAALRYLKAGALPQDHVCCWYAHVLEEHFRVAVRGIVVAVHAHWA